MLEVFQRSVVWECLGIILVAISSDKKQFGHALLYVLTKNTYVSLLLNLYLA